MRVGVDVAGAEGETGREDDDAADDGWYSDRISDRPSLGDGGGGGRWPGPISLSVMPGAALVELWPEPLLARLPADSVLEMAELEPSVELPPGLAPPPPDPTLPLPYVPLELDAELPARLRALSAMLDRPKSPSGARSSGRGAAGAGAVAGDDELATAGVAEAAAAPPRSNAEMRSLIDIAGR